MNKEMDTRIDEYLKDKSTTVDFKSSINTLKEKLYNYRERKNSKYSESRELIYKGYCVPFYIDKEDNAIVILGIYNQNLWNEN